MTKHLSTLNSISHLASHLPSASRYCCRRLVSFLSVMSRYYTQSSAKSLTLLLVIDSCRSLMYARNKTGPRTVPCGTPLVTGLGVEVSPSSSTRWVLSVRKADSTPSFTLGDGSVNDGYLHRDGVQLTHAAVNRLAKNMRLKKRNDVSGVCSGVRRPQHQHPHPPTAPSQGGDAEWTTVRHRGRQARQVSGATRASCYFCGGEGHTKDNCRHGRPIECNICHRPGHKSKCCPQ